MSVFKVGQQVRHAGFKSLGTIVQVLQNGSRLAVDFPGTNGIVDDRHNFWGANDKQPTRPRKRQMCSLNRGDYD
jgi:hypothetical protein